MTNLPPRVGGAPVLGALPRLLRDPIACLRSLADVAPVTRLGVGPWDIYLVNHPALAHEVLVSRVDEFMKAGLGKERFRPFAGDGITVADGETWRRARRMLNPLFGQKRVAAMAPAMTGAISEHLSTWEPHADSGAAINLSSELAALALGVLTATMFTRSLSDEERRELGRDWKSVINWMQARVVTPGLPEWVPLPYRREGAKALRRIEDKLWRMIDERGQGSEDADLLGALVAAREDGHRFSRTELRDHAINFLFAGHETTATSMNWALVLLEQHPVWAERATAEVDRELGQSPPALDDLQRLPVTKACWEEALRIAPVGTLTPRSARQDLALGGYRVPAGSPIGVNYVAVQSHPDFWSSPDDYDPGRFLDHEACERHRSAYLPFGAGPRACIGSLMGTMEGVFTMAMVLQRYRLSLAPGETLRTKMRLTINFQDGPHMRVHRRVAA